MDEIHHQDKHSPTFIQKAYAKSCDIVNETAEYFASWSIGQSVLRQTDRCLWTVEKCAEWSVPSAPVPKHNTSNGTFGKPGPLVRPLPWIFFLPMLLMLRVSRFSVNVCAMLMGLETVKPMGVVRFIQVRRRRIRALKFLGLRRIRHRKMQEQGGMTLRERFYNIMSRAMCFRVTNSDLYEQITVTNVEADPQTSKKQTKPVGETDLKRKYIEILKNNYIDWEDVEDDEELIDRITQLAEDDNDDDPDFLPAEDSATEEDSMSDTEDDAAVVATDAACHSSPKHVLHRPSSHGSLTTETITEENEDSDSTTVSANSDDESSQHITTGDTPQKSEEAVVANSKEENISATNVESAVTSDEYYSPMNSISASPEPKIDGELPKSNVQNNKPETANTNSKTDDKQETEKFINSETNQVNNQNASLPANHTPPIAAHETNAKANSNSHSSFSPRGHGKKHKHRRRFSNLLRRKRK